MEGWLRRLPSYLKWPAGCAVVVGVCLIVLLGTCGSRVAILLRANPCAGFTLAANDSLPFYAIVSLQTPNPGGAGFSGSDELLYSSKTAPRLVRWKVEYPLPSTPQVQYESRGEAEVTRRGVLIGRAPGTVFVAASSLGKNTREKVQIVPRVIRFGLRPRDTTVHVGDSLIVHADFEIEGQQSAQHLKWIMPRRQRTAERQLDLVEKDPDDTVKWDQRDLRLTAIGPGTAHIRACAASGREDSVAVRVVGEALPMDQKLVGLPVLRNRDEPPALRFGPNDTTLYVGESFRPRLRILNASNRNSPWRWRVSFGDGGISEGTRDVFVTSAWGFTVDDVGEHVYDREGKFTLAATVTDSAGRTTTTRTSITAAVAESVVEVLPGDASKVVRLSDPRPDIPFIIRGTPDKRVRMQELGWLATSQREAGLPLLRFGRTVFEFDPDAGFSIEVRDDASNIVVHVDKAALRRNGDIHLGRNRLVVTGAVARPYYEGTKRPYTPIRGTTVFDVVP